MNIEGLLVHAGRQRLLRRGGGQRERLGLGARPVRGRRGELHPRHRPDLLDQRQQRQPEAVAEFIDYLFSPDTQAALVTQCGLPPAPVELDPADLADLDPRHADLLGALNEASAANDYGYTTWTFWPPETETYLYEEVEKVWSGEMTAEQYLQGHQERFDAEREAGAVPPIPAR
jgi:raffinose/stachyose/melibiose transport system substrate-binding protein